MKVGVHIQITQMDGTSVIDVTDIDTAINPNPRDPTGEAMLAGQMAQRMAEEVNNTTQERIREYNESIARLLGG